MSYLGPEKFACYNENLVISGLQKHYRGKLKLGTTKITLLYWKFGTVEPLYNEVLGTMKITLLYQVSHYIRVKKQRYIKSWDQQIYLVIRGFCYIRPRYNEVPLYISARYNESPLYTYQLKS